MTPDSPKGPENEARTEESLRERIERAINDEAPVWDEQFEAGHGIVCSVSDAAVVAARTVTPELERLTAEVERLNDVRLNVRNQWRADLDEIADALGLEKDLPTVRIVHWAKDSQAEVSRLREQLAAQTTLPQDAEDQLRVAISDPGSRLPRKAWTLEVASEPIHRWSARAVLDLLKSWGVSSSEAPQPAGPKKNDGLWQQIWDALDSKNPGDVCESLLDDYTDLACAAVQGWLGEQEEHAREARQHKVFVRPAEKEWWKATCPTCDLVQYSPSKQRAEDWKDQHEADTLRPVESPNQQANQQTACSICGSTEIQYQPFSGGKEYYCPSCEDVHPYDEGRAPRRAQMLQRGEFDALKQEMRDHLEGRPSGSERLAPPSGWVGPHEPPAYVVALAQPEGSYWKYLIRGRESGWYFSNELAPKLPVSAGSGWGWAYSRAELPLRPVTQVRDVHGDVWAHVPGTFEWSSPETQNCAWSYMVRKWSPLTEVVSTEVQDAAQAARSEATPEPHFSFDCPDMDGCPAHGSPSPSLPKEGEDQ